MMPLGLTAITKEFQSPAWVVGVVAKSADAVFEDW